MTHPDPSFEAIRSAARSEGRTLVIEGVRWHVFELPPGSYDRRGKPTLIFECMEAMRRVREYPANWRQLPDQELADLRNRR